MVFFFLLCCASSVRRPSQNQAGKRGFSVEVLFRRSRETPPLERPCEGDGEKR